MSKNIEELKKFYEKLAKERSDFNDVAVLLEIAAKMSRRLGAPESISDILKATSNDIPPKDSALPDAEKIKIAWQKRIIEFFVTHTSPSADIQNLQTLAAPFNKEFRQDLTNDIPLSYLLIPATYSLWEKEDLPWLDKVNQIDKATRANYNRYLNALIRHYPGGANAATIGWFRQTPNRTFLGFKNVGPGAVNFWRTAAAQPKHEIPQ